MRRIPGRMVMFVLSSIFLAFEGIFFVRRLFGKGDPSRPVLQRL